MDSRGLRIWWVGGQTGIWLYSNRTTKKHHVLFAVCRLVFSLRNVCFVKRRTHEHGRLDGGLYVTQCSSKPLTTHYANIGGQH